MPGTRWVLVVPLLVLTVELLVQGQLSGATVAGAALLVILSVGNKFELDVTHHRFRVGYHWVHLLNLPWQPLPPVQGVVVKGVVYRDGIDSRYSWKPLGVTRKVYTVLLSVPNSPQGVVVASMEDEAPAEETAAEMAAALQVPWRRA